MNTFPKLFTISIATALVACSVPSITFRELPDRIGGTVAGLTGTGLVLTNNGGDDLSIGSNGVFMFTTPIERGASYAVAVKSQPSNPTQMCSVSHGSSTTGDEDVTDVQVNCSVSAFSVGGTVTGLAGTGLVLQDGVGDNVAVNADGTFTFPTPVASGASYDVTVLTQPSHLTQECTVAGGTGKVGASNVTDVAVSCTTSTFTIGGTVTGLAGVGLVLQDNGGDDLPINADGGFTFATPIASGSTFAVTVLTQPSQATQVCTVANGAGAVDASNIVDVTITCATSAFTIGGTVTGLAGTGLVLEDNGGDDLSIGGDGPFTFPTPVASGASYVVTVAAQPSQPTQVCTVSGGTGIVGATNVTNVEVTCTTSAFKIGGTVTGLAGTGLVLQNNGGDDLPVSSDGSFQFPTPVTSGATFEVTVLTQPSQPTQTCTVAGGTGTVGSGNVTSVAINCATNRYMISGTISGLAGTVTLQNNGGDDLDVTSNGTFAFATSVLSGSAYNVTVKGQPTAPISQTCTIGNGAGIVGGDNVTNVIVTCTTNRFTIGGTVVGLAAGDSITLRDNGGDDLVRSANGGFTFATPVASGQSYAVTIVANPAAPISQTCTVANAAGTVGNSNVTNVIVTCTTNAFTIGGTVSGLAAGDSITLRDNGGDDLLQSANGSFTFSTPVASGQLYGVTIVANPAAPISQTCTVANGAGTVGAGNVTNVSVTCTTNAFTIGGTVSGLAAGDSITLRDNGGDDLLQSANGSFTFSTPVASGQLYGVTIVANPTSPISQTCTVANGAGTVGASNVTNVAVTCTVQARMLVAINDANGHLERIDPVTLTVTDIGPLGVSYAFGDCMFNPADSTLYMVDGRGAQGLYRVNIATGAVSLVGLHGISAMEAIAFHPPTNRVYGMSIDVLNLYALSTTTGAAAVVGPIGSNFQGMAWDSKRNVMVGYNGSQMFSINVSTGAMTLLASAGPVRDFGMTYDPVLDRFWVVDFTGQIIQFDPNQGFARTLTSTVPGQHTCIASVPQAP